MLEHFPRPIVLAHRGDLAHAPENTLPSFQQAIQKGADGVELDTKLTSDSHVIVIHDMAVERTSDGMGRVASFTLDAIRKLDAGSWFDQKFRGTKVPLLEEVFETVGKERLMNVELTNYSTPRDGLVDKVCDLIKRHNNHEQIIFSSFFAPNLKRAFHLLPEIPRGLLAMPGLAGIWARSFGFMFDNYQALHPYISSVDRQQIRRVDPPQIRAAVWTANTPQGEKKQQKRGGAGLFSHHPQKAVPGRAPGPENYLPRRRRV